MIKKTESYPEYVRKLYKPSDPSCRASREVTFQITSECNLRCSYCYEHNKEKSVMSLDTAKKIINSFLDMYEKNDGNFINKHTIAVVLNFIGGEPLLEAKLIEDICDYWILQCFERGTNLAPFTKISFATNGLLWFSPESQHLIKKYHDMMSLTVSIDGIKELHDKYRVDKDGNGSFDKAYEAFVDAKKYGWNYTKMTFVPSSFNYIFDSIKFMVDEGCDEVYCNCAFEPKYSLADAYVLYNELQKVSDYMINNKLETFISILDDTVGYPESNDNNFCGGTGETLSFAPDGKAYPCIRYAPISVGKELASKMCLGDCFSGLYNTEEQKRVKCDLDCITRTSQSSKECLECDIASGCGWCSGYNYECFGTPNKRSTNICYAHKGRTLAVCYYYNKRYLEIGDCIPKHIYLPVSEVIEILGYEKAKDLFKLEINAMMKYAELHDYI